MLLPMQDTRTYHLPTAPCSGCCSHRTHTHTYHLLTAPICACYSQYRTCNGRVPQTHSCRSQSISHIPPHFTMPCMLLLPTGPVKGAPSKPAAAGAEGTVGEGAAGGQKGGAPEPAQPAPLDGGLVAFWSLKNPGYPLWCVWVGVSGCLCGWVYVCSCTIGWGSGSVLEPEEPWVPAMVRVYVLLFGC